MFSRIQENNEQWLSNGFLQVKLEPNELVFGDNQERQAEAFLKTLFNPLDFQSYKLHIDPIIPRGTSFLFEVEEIIPSATDKIGLFYTTANRQKFFVPNNEPHLGFLVTQQLLLNEDIEAKLKDQRTFFMRLERAHQHTQSINVEVGKKKEKFTMKLAPNVTPKLIIENAKQGHSLNRIRELLLTDNEFFETLKKIQLQYSKLRNKTAPEAKNKAQAIENFLNSFNQAKTYQDLKSWCENLLDFENQLSGLIKPRKPYQLKAFKNTYTMPFFNKTTPEGTKTYSLLKTLNTVITNKLPNVNQFLPEAHQLELNKKTGIRLV